MGEVGHNDLVEHNHTVFQRFWDSIESFQDKDDDNHEGITVDFWNKGIADDPEKKNTKGKHHSNSDLGRIKYEFFFLQFIFIDGNQDTVTIVRTVCKDFDDQNSSNDGKDITKCGSGCQLREDGCLASMEISSVYL